jgi:hypothetical protein
MMGDGAEYYGDPGPYDHVFDMWFEQGVPEKMILRGMPSELMGVFEVRKEVFLRGKEPVPEGYWQQRNGKLIQISTMGLQHLANTLRMIERNNAQHRSARYTALVAEWNNRGLGNQEWREEHFSQETYEEMLKTR